MFRAVAQGFSVQVWGTWGRRFKSAQPDTGRGLSCYKRVLFFALMENAVWEQQGDTYFNYIGQFDMTEWLEVKEEVWCLAEKSKKNE